MLTQAPKGTQDMLPKDAYRWQDIARTMREACALAGYQEIRTPVFEHTELFQRGVEEATAQAPMWEMALCGNTTNLLANLGRALISTNAFFPAEQREDIDEITEYLSAHEDLYSGDIFDFAFREAIRQGATEYIEENAENFDLNDGCGYSTYLQETDDEDVQDLLMELGAFRSWEEYCDCKSVG